ncbi:MAG: DNA-directed RNA polymerase sigma-70 factor [Betaproteobacteria bacterium]|nr:MAG: DNA-directed RNA polymerase sigma-70 factor [Betaproteobacteria bacterium]
MGHVTQLLARVRAGDAAALDALFAELYPELRRLAHARLARGGRHTMLETTSLVHECYLKFAEAGRLDVNDRAHFHAYAARAMRSIIVDYARHRMREKRGGDAAHQTLNTELIDGLPAGDEQIVRVHEALDELARRDARLVQVVEMRYFAGLSEQEIATSLGVTERTVRRDWEKARLLLADALRS